MANQVGSVDEMRAAIASRLKCAREQARLTQAEVASALGLHRPAVSQIEAGRRSVSAEELAILAKLYAVNVSWLLDIREPDPDRDRVELAAQVLSKLPQEELERLLTALRGSGTRRGSRTERSRPRASRSTAR